MKKSLINLKNIRAGETYQIKNCSEIFEQKRFRCSEFIFQFDEEKS